MATTALRAKLLLPSLAALTLWLTPVVAGAATPDSSSPFASMHWRNIGPFRGGRALAVAGVPGEPDVFYFGAAAGGVWKTMDAGSTWKPVFDHEPISSIGAIAVAPSNHSVVYVGAGEGALRGNISYGDGVYKSLDAGKTWTNIGLKDTRQIGAIIVDPANPDVVMVAAIGHAFGPNAERGVFRSADGGRTWTKVLYRDADTGAIDVTFDPNDSKIVYAALWQVRRQPWNFSSGGPGSGLFRSTDGGAMWSELKGQGLPAGILGRIDVAVSAANSKRIYAMIEAADGGLYRSDDAGAHWMRVSQDGRIRQRAWYFSKIYADPKAVDTVYALNTGMLRSTDGGKSFNLVSATHGDHHALWIDPGEPKRLINANDGGASVSLDGGTTWSTQNNQPTAQFYHVATDMRFPYWVYGAQQDNSNLGVASFDDEGVIGPADFYPVGGGEAGWVVPDPRDADIVYSDSENSVNRFDKRSEQSQDISPDPVDNSGHPASELQHRFNWTSPMMLSPHDPDSLYVASEAVWKTTDHGKSWRIISGDLTRNDKSKQIASGGPLTKDITSVEYYDTIFALAESPLRKGMLWAGTDDGVVQTSPDDGGHWSKVTPAGLPEWSTISMIEPSHYDAGVAYIAVDRHKLDDIAPYAWKTTDGGRSWAPITRGLPQGAIVHVVREDPARRGLLYAGTELGVFVSLDDGGRWAPLQLDLPVTPIHDLVVKGDDLVAATHGRAFWVLDDLTPLRQATPVTMAQALWLYTPETATRLYYPEQVESRRPVGENPPAGALIDYVLKAKPTDEMTLDILDAQGRSIRHISSKFSAREKQPPEWPDQVEPPHLIPAEAGMNRFVWDLRMDDPVQIPGAFYSGEAPRGPIAAPGRYQVKLTLAGVTRTAPLVLAPDPRTHADASGIEAKTALAEATVHDIDALHRAVNEIRAAKAKLAGAAGPVSSGRAATILQLSQVEETLMQVNMKGSEANLAFPGMLNEQYATFASILEDADTAPTSQQLLRFQSLHDQLTVQLAAWTALKGRLIA
ncbi:glycosyl hydrolase [Caulobacter sp. S45]|uniref:WD40/YVTN/BNR-like repeat-containing protein n=1 Tax=Caulobacter sp. S45 TaxID=1641861 RepID=UPI001576B8B9|nr:glycosyl hydrolase [Caulobacter sp. S45]